MRVPESGHPEELGERDVSAAYPCPAVDPIKLQDAVNRTIENMTKAMAYYAPATTVSRGPRFIIRRWWPGEWSVIDTHRIRLTWHPTWAAAMAHVSARLEIRPTRRSGV